MTDHRDLEKMVLGGLPGSGPLDSPDGQLTMAAYVHDVISAAVEEDELVGRGFLGPAIEYALLKAAEEARAEERRHVAAVLEHFDRITKRQGRLGPWRRSARLGVSMRASRGRGFGWPRLRQLLRGRR